MIPYQAQYSLIDQLLLIRSEPRYRRNHSWSQLGELMCYRKDVCSSFIEMIAGNNEEQIIEILSFINYCCYEKRQRCSSWDYIKLTETILIKIKNLPKNVQQQPYFVTLSHLLHHPVFGESLFGLLFNQLYKSIQLGQISLNLDILEYYFETESK